MSQFYRVRYARQHAARVRPEDVLTADLPCELNDILGRLPAEAYLLDIEDLTEGRAVHWTRWPKALRPGFADAATGRVVR